MPPQRPPPSAESPSCLNHRAPEGAPNSSVHVSRRLFDVYANGVALLRNFDIFKEAGGEDRPLHKVFHSLQPNAQGKLVFSFVPVKNYACINAIEVLDEGR